MLNSKARTILVLLLLTCGITAFITACKKGDSLRMADPTAFTPEAAKEWYYGTFKKNSEWASYDGSRRGVKLPDWKHGTYHRVGNMEVAEFPLTKVKSTLFVPSNGRSAADGRRLAEATLTRVAFIKMDNGQVYVREINYIPDWEYASKKGFDISENSLSEMDKSFSGRVVIKTWGEEEISRRRFVNGKSAGLGRMRPVPTATSSGLATQSISTNGCTLYEICEWERECEYTWVGDMLEKNCEPWGSTGNCWYEEYCDGDGGCDPGVADCQCVLYGICPDGGGGEEEQDCAKMEDDMQGSGVSEKESTELVSETSLERTKKYKWVIFKQNLGLWKFMSHEGATHEKTNDPQNPWKFKTFFHESISRSGLFVGGTVTLTVNSTEPYIGAAGYAAGIEIDYTVVASAVCKGFPMSGEWNPKSSAVWTINE